ncbi:MAG: SGNH/GDSL hydrolase family protein [Clostridia bacterium]|nr:SGNH/GDSL hydrolase family protein [Clostridia bacterium]
MKKVTLLGDSIRMGYGKRVEELLKDEFEIYQPEDNCRFSKYTLRGVLYEWSKQIEGSDVIHWNNGLWDMCDFGEGVFSTKEEYAENMKRIARLLKKRGKTVIFATTTPVREGNPYDDNQRIVEYNNFIAPILSEMGVLINDLHSVVAPDINKYIREDDKIHLTDEGIEVCAKKVIESIKSAL